ncbi:unnamed protein product [Amoebophrya sp. A120]|nr:unnamed protein product [Amoebophrya sp. A120]|eukprot:GSA120T00021170001.1
MKLKMGSQHLASNLFLFAAGYCSFFLGAVNVSHALQLQSGVGRGGGRGASTNRGRVGSNRRNYNSGNNNGQEQGAINQLHNDQGDDDENGAAMAIQHQPPVQFFIPSGTDDDWGDFADWQAAAAAAAQQQQGGQQDQDAPMLGVAAQPADREEQQEALAQLGPRGSSFGAAVGAGAGASSGPAAASSSSSSQEHGPPGMMNFFGRSSSSWAGGPGSSSSSSGAASSSTTPWHMMPAGAGSSSFSSSSSSGAALVNNFPGGRPFHSSFLHPENTTTTSTRPAPGSPGSPGEDTTTGQARKRLVRNDVRDPSTPMIIPGLHRDRNAKWRDGLGCRPGQEQGLQLPGSSTSMGPLAEGPSGADVEVGGGAFVSVGAPMPDFIVTDDAIQEVLYETFRTDEALWQAYIHYFPNHNSYWLGCNLTQEGDVTALGRFPELQEEHREPLNILYGWLDDALGRHGRAGHRQGRGGQVLQYMYLNLQRLLRWNTQNHARLDHDAMTQAYEEHQQQQRRRDGGNDGPGGNNGPSGPLPEV